MKPTERLARMDELLSALMGDLSRQRNLSNISPRLEANIARVGQAQIQVDLLQLEGDLEAKGFNAAIDAAQDMGKNASYLKVGEFVGLLEHIRKPVEAKVT